MNKIAMLPDIPGRRARVNAAQRADDQAKATARAVKRAKAMMNDPRGYTDEQLGTACGWFMKQSNADRDDDGNVYYQRADQLLFAIERRRQVMVNEAKCRAALARIDDRDEAARLALARKKLGLFTVAWLLAMAVIVMCAGLGWVRW